MFDEGDGSRAEWTADLLPDDLKDMVAGIMEQGLAVMKRTLEAEVGDNPMLFDSVTSQQVVRVVGEGQQSATPGNIFGSHHKTNEQEMQAGVPRRTRSPSLHHVSLFVTDLEASRKFYTVGLGLKLRQPFRDITGRRDNTTFRFGLPSVFLETANGCYVELHTVDGGKNSFLTFPLNHFALMMADVDAAYEQALKSGAKPVDIPVVSRSWDGSPLDVIMDGDNPEPIRMAFILGPNNEIIEIYHETKRVSFQT